MALRGSVRMVAAVLRERLRPGGLSRAQMAARFARSTPPHAIRRWPLPRATSDARTSSIF